MICPHCGKAFTDPGRAKGGRAKVAKGFASPSVMRKALATRRRNREAKRPGTPQ